MNKKLSLRALKNRLKKLKQQGKTIAFTNGCFDLLHPGHIKILKYAKSKGDILVIGLNSDRSVKKIKGNSRPILDQRARIITLSAIEYVDFIVLFDEATPYNLIKELKPHILVKGSDWKTKNIVGNDVVKKTYRVELLKNYSTTGILKKILRACKK